MSGPTGPAPPLRTVTNEYPSVLPHNIEAEQAVLGILLLNNDIYFKVFEIIDAGDFYDPVHGRIYDAIAKTIDAGRVADARTLHGQFERDEALNAVGGARYLADLAASIVTPFGVEDYARFLHELATRRRLIAFTNEIKSIAFDQSAPPASGDELITQAETLLYKIAERRGRDGAVDITTAFQETIDVIDASVKNAGKVCGVPSGIAQIDQILGGFEAGKLYTIAGRPSMGKTAMGLTIATNAAQTGAKTLFYSLEMERPDIIKRLIARQTGIPANKQRGNITPDDFVKIVQTQGEITSWPIYVDADTRLNVSQIRGRAIRQKRRYGLNLIVIDYLGLMGVTEKKQNRNYEIEDITQGLKSLAKELKVPVLLLAQLNRELERRDDKRPMLSDLRDSGAVEQDSDVVMFVYRHEYYVSKAEPRQQDRENDERFNDRYARWEKELADSRGKGELIIAKHRQGETGAVKLRFQGWKCLFVDDEVAHVCAGQP